MNIWERQPDELKNAYDVFSIFRDNPKSRINVKLAEDTNTPLSTVENWKRAYNWVERAEAYDRYCESEVRREQGKMIAERAYRHVDELKNVIDLLLVTPRLYATKLREGGIDKLKELDIETIRAMSRDDTELLSKIIKIYNEAIELTEEGREIKQLGRSADKIQIIINRAPETNVIDITPEKIKEIDE